MTINENPSTQGGGFSTSSNESYWSTLWRPEVLGVWALVVLLIGAIIRLKRAVPVDPSSISLFTISSTEFSTFEFENPKRWKNRIKRNLVMMLKPSIFLGFCKKFPTRIWNFYIDTFLVPSYRLEWGKYREWSYRSPRRTKLTRLSNGELAKLRKLETTEQRYRRATIKPIEGDVTNLQKVLKDQLLATTIQPSAFHDHSECQRVRINVGGSIYETQLKTLNRYPDTLLGDPHRRLKFYNPRNQEYFFDRNRASFETILYFYQSGGRFRRPENLAADIILDDAKFYGLPQNVIYQFLLDEGLTYATQPDDILPASLFLRKMWLLFDYPESSLQARIVAIISIASIILSISAFCLETESILAASHRFDIDEFTGMATHTPFHAVDIADPFFTVETICIAWFAFEYLARLISCPDKGSFLIQLLNLIDFIAIVPYFFTLANKDEDDSGKAYRKSATSSFSTIKVVRLVRVFRIFKLSRHSKGLKILGKTLQASLNELILLIMFVMIGVVLFSSAIYFAEQGAVNSRFPSIPDGFWWAIITITTLGYGDVVPDTPFGRVIGALCAVTGVLTIALPVPVIVSNFNFFYNQAIGERDLSWLKISHVPACPFRPLDGYRDGDTNVQDQDLPQQTHVEKVYSSDDEFGELKDRALLKQGVDPTQRGRRSSNGSHKSAPLNPTAKKLK